MICNDDVYLLQQQYHFPKLRYLRVNSDLAPRPGKPRINDDFDYSTRIFEDLLIIYGNCLKVLEVNGVWNLEISDTKPIPVPALETLYLNRKTIYTKTYFLFEKIMRKLTYFPGTILMIIFISL